EDGRARPGDLGLQWNAEADLHVGRPQLDAALIRRDLHAGQRLHGAARRRDAGDRLKGREEVRARAGDLHLDSLSIRTGFIGAVSSRDKYMATWRGQATRADRVEDTSSSRVMPNASHAARWTSSTVRRTTTRPAG